MIFSIRIHVCDNFVIYSRRLKVDDIVTNITTSEVFISYVKHVLLHVSLVDGVWSDWGAWHTCTVSCDGGTQERTRVCNFKKGSPHGANCQGETHESQACGTELCPGILQKNFN